MIACAHPRAAGDRLRCTSLIALALGATAWAGCGGHNGPEKNPRGKLPPAYQVPARAETAGDSLMALAPSGADIALEVDIARLRANPVVGPLIAQLASTSLERAAGPIAGVQGDWLDATDALLLCAYHVGGASAVTITLIRGSAPIGARLDPRTSVLADADWVARVRAVAAGDAPPLADDRAFMRIRTHAMPAAAQGGFLRIAARLGFEARVALAGRLDLDAVPAALSVWADVADDFAVIAQLDGTEPDDGETLKAGAAAAVDRLAQVPWIRARYLHFILRTVDISARDTTARMTLVIGPKRLHNLVARAMRSLTGDSHTQLSPRSP